MGRPNPAGTLCIVYMLLQRKRMCINVPFVQYRNACIKTISMAFLDLDLFSPASAALQATE